MSEEIAAAAADLATVEQLRAHVKRLSVERAMAGADSGALFLALERLLAFVTNGRVLPLEDRALIERVMSADHPGAQLLAEREQHESQLGAAHAEIARLEEALRQVTKMKTIKGARRIVADALEGEIALTKARSE